MISKFKSGLGLALILKDANVEASLWRRFKSGDDSARNALFERYHHIATKIARSQFRIRQGLGLEPNDFEHFAVAGLLEAMDNFDPGLGAKFSSFASYRIKGSISDGLRRATEKNTQSEIRRKLEKERLKSLIQDEECVQSETPVQQVAEIAVNLAIGLILEAEGREHMENTGDAPIDALALRQLNRSLMDAVERLPPPEDTVIKHHYLDGIAFTEIARLLKLSKGRISQLHKAAISKLRKSLKHFA